MKKETHIGVSVENDDIGPARRRVPQTAFLCCGFGGTFGIAGDMGGDDGPCSVDCAARRDGIGGGRHLGGGCIVGRGEYALQWRAGDQAGWI